MDNSFITIKKKVFWLLIILFYHFGTHLSKAQHDNSSVDEFNIFVGFGPSSSPEWMTCVNIPSLGDIVFFSANSTGGRELYMSDGESVDLVKDINFVGSNSSNPTHFTGFDGEVYFFVETPGNSASNSGSKGDLWKSDGTSGGTEEVKDLASGTFFPDPQELVVVGSNMFFVATDPTDGRELWISDGTPAGTKLLKDINTSGDSNPQNLVSVGNQLFFTADDGVHGEELWVSDGTVAGTQMVSDINLTGSSSPRTLINHSGFCYFIADDGVSGYRLWFSNGTTLTNISPLNTIDSDTELVSVGTIVFFKNTDPTHGTELWRADGSTLGTQMVFDINSGSASSLPAWIVDVNGEPFFAARNGSDVLLYKSNSTGVGFVEQVGPTTITNPEYLTNVGGTLYFVADSPQGRELHISDGTAAGTTIFFDQTPGAVGAQILEQIVPCDCGFFYVAKRGGFLGNFIGEELYHVDCCEPPSFEYSSNDLCQSAGIASPQNIVPDPVTHGYGTFSGPPQVVFTGTNPGEIDLNASTPGGPYIIEYAVSTGDFCDLTAFYLVNIEPGSEVTYDITTFATGFNFNTLPVPAGSATDGPTGMAFSPDLSRVYVADENNNSIKQIISGSVTTLATGFNEPAGIAVDAQGMIYVADKNNHQIKRVNPNVTPATVTVVAGTGVLGDIDNPDGLLAAFNLPTDVVVDFSGNIYVADKNNHKVRKIAPDGAVTTLAGDGIVGFADGIGTSARFSLPSGLGIDLNGDIYVADRNNHCIRKILTSTGEVSTFAGTNTSGFVDGNTSTARFRFPMDVSVDPLGQVYIADRSNYAIRKVTGNEVETLAGTNTTCGFFDGPTSIARFCMPDGIMTDLSGNFYVGDNNNNRIRNSVENNDLGTITGSLATCNTTNSGTLTLIDYPDSDPSNITEWISSTDGGVNWTSLGNGGSDTYNYTNITQTTVFRALVEKGNCSADSSGYATILISTPGTPSATSADVEVCGTTGPDPIVATLEANGAGDGLYRWYDVPTGGVSLGSNAIYEPTVTGNTTFYVAIANGLGCEGARIPINVVVIPPSDGGTLDADATVCEGSNSGTLTVTGETGNVVRWESSEDGGTTWTTIANTANTQDYTNLLITTQYRVVVQNSFCPEALSNIVTITIDAPTIAGTLDSDATICEGSLGSTLNLTGSTGNVIRWESSEDGGTTWTNIAHTTATYDYPVLTTTTQYRAFVQNGTCPEVASNVITITVDPTSDGGTLDADATVCEGSNNGTLTVTGETGNVVRWESSEDGGTTWTIIPNTNNTQDYINLTVTTQYRVFVQSGICPEVASNIVTITVDPTSDGGTLDADATVCEGSSGSPLNLTGETGNIVRWESSEDGGTTWTNITHTTATYNYPPLTTTTQYRVFVQSGTCPEVASNIVTITVDPTSDGGTLDADATVCEGSNNGTLTVTGETGNVVRWESSEDGGTTWTIIPNTNNTQDYTNLTVTTQYRVFVQSGICPEVASNIVTITVDPTSDGGTLDADATICEGNSGSPLNLTGETGNIVRWESSEDGGTTWTNITHTTATYNYPPLTTTTQYRVFVQSGTCQEVASNIVTITVDPASNGGTLDADATVCEGSNNGTLTLSGEIGNIVRWESSIDNGTNWITIPNTNNTQDYTNLTVTTQYRVFVQSGVCPEVASNIVTITVDPTSDGGTLDADATICEGNSGSPLNLTGETGNVVRWESSEDGGTTWTNITHTATTYNYPPLTTTTQYRVFVQSGVCPELASNVITITVEPASVGGVVNSDVVVCQGMNNGSVTLTGETGDVVRWEQSVDGGITWTPTPIVNMTNTQSYNNLVLTTRYRAIIQNGICPEVASTEAMVSVIPQPTPTITTLGETSIISPCEGSLQDYETPSVPGSTYEWSVTGGTIIGANDQNQVSIQWNMGTIGELTVIERIGGTSCETTITENIMLLDVPEPEIDSASPVEACENSVATYQTVAPLDINSTYIWTVTGGTVVAGANTNQIDVEWNGTGTGTVQVRQIYTHGCDSTTNEFSVIINPNPSVPTVNASTVLCNDPGNVDLYASEPNAVTYRWYDALTGGTLLGEFSDFYAATGLTSAGSPYNFYVSAVDSKGCEGDRATVTVTINAASVITLTSEITNVETCDNSNSGIIDIDIIDGTSPYDYEVLLDGNAYETGTVPFGIDTLALTDLAVGEYTVNITDAGGCQVSDIYTIIEDLKPITNAQIRVDGIVLEQDTILQGESIQLEAFADNAGDEVFYSWTPVEGLSATDIPNPTASPLQTTNYQVVISNEKGCTDTAFVNIVIRTIEIFVPNVFAPVSEASSIDSEAKVLKVYGNGIAALEFKVFDRKGFVVYETNDMEEATTIGWDGTFNGTPQPSGNYVWYLKVIYGNENEDTFKGNTLLMR